MQKWISRIKKRRWLIAILFIIGVVFLFSSNKIQIEHIEVYFKDLPKELDGFKIVHLSDLHFPKNVSSIENILQLVSAQKPDMIVMTGDMIDYATDVSPTELQEFCEGLVQIADVYAVSGNHERWRSWNGEDWHIVFTDSGVHLIDRSSVVIGDFTLVGLGDGQRLNKVPHGFTVILSHRPTAVRSRRPIDAKDSLIFSGHAHGGLFRVPFIGGGIAAPDQRFFPKYTSGLYELPSGSKLVVSRGLGDSLIPFRINNRPHIPVVTLRVQK